MQKHGLSVIGGNTVMGGRFSNEGRTSEFLEKTAAGGQGTAYVNNWQAVLAAAEYTIYGNPARRHPERRWL